MATPLFRTPNVILAQLDQDDLAEAQAVFDSATDYHRLLTGNNAPEDAAARCFHREPPKPQKGIRTFKYFLALMPTPDRERDVGEVGGVTDVFVGYPAYHIATIATFIVARAHQRKGLGRTAIAAMIDWLRQDHPAVQWLDVSITDDNLVATRFLATCGFQRTNTWYPVTVAGKEKRVIRLELKFG